MKFERLSHDRKLGICRKYFMAGFALLPFMWAVNAIWFLKEAFCATPYPEQKQIRTYVIVSGIGAIVWLVGINILGDNFPTEPQQVGGNG
ncbi:gamma-secretase subunit PEN-2-like, partial [Penaeus indicus]|uniref:gamma-secretase subunit PEN-2-like n=1 Tax=Penaeus indicus TaxID=29960 RepID=UPI00300D7179